MEMVAYPVAIMGFIFGPTAFTQVSAASARITRLEQRLNEAGVLAKYADNKTS